MTKISITTLIGACLLMLCMNTNAARVEAVEDAYELPASNVLAVSEKDKGEFVFKSCDSCAASRLKMTASTYFEINREAVSRSIFWAAVRRSKGDVYLFVEISTGNVSRVKLDEKVSR